MEIGMYHVENHRGVFFIESFEKSLNLTQTRL